MWKHCVDACHFNDFPLGSKLALAPSLAKAISRSTKLRVFKGYIRNLGYLEPSNDHYTEKMRDSEDMAEKYRQIEKEDEDYRMLPKEDKVYDIYIKPPIGPEASTVPTD